MSEIKRVIRNGKSIIALCDEKGEIFKVDLETRRYVVANICLDDFAKAKINHELENVGMNPIFKVKPSIMEAATRKNTRKGWGARYTMNSRLEVVK